MSYVAARFDAPVHFPAGRHGECLALATIAGWSSSAPPGTQISSLADSATEVLRESREAYTLERAYYRNIERLHYLYDDFNDRRLHVKHALHMAGSELTSILEAIVIKRNQ